jgi:hypothetical protein
VVVDLIGTEVCGYASPDPSSGLEKRDQSDKNGEGEGLSFDDVNPVAKEQLDDQSHDRALAPFYELFAREPETKQHTIMGVYAGEMRGFANSRILPKPSANQWYTSTPLSAVMTVSDRKMRYTETAM